MDAPLDAAFCNLATAQMSAQERASQIFEKILANSSDKSVLSECHQRAFDLFLRFNDRFALSDFELGTTSLYEHDIVVKDEKDLPRMAGRPVPLGYRQPLTEMLRTYLAMEVISHSSSEYSSPVVLVRKKDGSLRMCIDYRKLNRAIKLSQWPMPNIDVMLQSLSGKKFFTTCDLHSGYWQIPLTEHAKEYTK
ncbi:gagpol and env protein precursor, partial [Aphelenchoides avenae]